MMDLKARDMTELERMRQRAELPHSFAELKAHNKEAGVQIRLAPLAGVSDSAYRTMARLGGASTTCTEMISVAGLWHKSRVSYRLFEPGPFEEKLGVQLFGRDPDQFSYAAETVIQKLQNSLLYLDINMACPVRKVVRKGEGAALLKDPEQALMIVSSVRKVCPRHIPLSVKLRLGYDEAHKITPSFLSELSACGVSSATVHGRLATQLYRGTSAIEEVADLARTSALPIFVSGDMLSPLDIAKAVQTDCFAGVYVARGSLGNPWIFSDALYALRKTLPPQRSLKGKLNALKLHLRLMRLSCSNVGRARLITLNYLKEFSGASRARARVSSLNTWDEYDQFVDSLIHAVEVQDA